MMLLQNQFNKRTDFLIISITLLLLFPNQILCSFNDFDKRVYGFVLMTNQPLSYSNKIKNKIKYQTSDHFQHLFRFMLHFQVSSYNFYSLFLSLPTSLYCIDLKISPWWRLRKGGWYKAFYKQGAWYYSWNKIKYCGDTTCKAMLDICKIRCTIVSSVTKKTS